MDFLKLAWKEGLEVFLYDEKLNARRKDGPLTDGDKSFLKKYKAELIQGVTAYQNTPRISGEDFYGPGLMADARSNIK